MDAYHKSPELPPLSGQAKVLRLYVPFTTVRRMCQGAVGTAEIRLTDQIHPPWKHATVPDPKRHRRESTRVHTVLRQRRTCCYLSQSDPEFSQRGGCEDQSLRAAKPNKRQVWIAVHLPRAGAERLLQHLAAVQ